MSEASHTAGSPTIVLVHGAFADGSTWNGVIQRLQHQGYSVVAPPNPLRGLATDSILNTAQVQRQYPTGQDSETAVEFTINPDLFREVFAADLPAEQTAVMAATQRPVAAAAFTDVSGLPGWRTLPSWAVVATPDKAAGTDVVRSMAQRAGADLVEVEGSHVIMVSQPQAVADLIVKAARTVSPADR
jgi:pimeloyl-ACP methyl ester carboxylesterase